MSCIYLEDNGLCVKGCMCIPDCAYYKPRAGFGALVRTAIVFAISVIVYLIAILAIPQALPNVASYNKKLVPPLAYQQWQENKFAGSEE